jgi:hypothetical protein
VNVRSQITPRDIDIVRHVARHRFLASQHLCRLVNGSGQGIARRLQALFHAGFLDRPRAQLDYYLRGGSKPLVYGLGTRGAKSLYARGEKSSIDWTVKNQNATRLFIDHTLRVADFMVGLQVACREAGLQLEWPLQNSERLRWRVAFSHSGENVSFGVIPDAAFGLTMLNGETVYYCLEVDCATMPVKRRSLHQTSVHRKFLAYHATWQQRMLPERFGWKRFRVLTLTTSAERAENLRQTAAELPSGHGLFLFGHFDQLAEAQDILSLSWFGVTDDVPVTLRGQSAGLPART